MTRIPNAQPPDVVEAGRVLAQLDDLRAIMYMAAFLFVFFILFTIWREWAMHAERKLMAEERKQMRILADSFAASAKEVAAALGNLATKIAVLSALTARAEATISQSDHEKKREK